MFAGVFYLHLSIRVSYFTIKVSSYHGHAFEFRYNVHMLWLVMHAWLRHKGVSSVPRWTSHKKFIFLFNNAKLDKIYGVFIGYPNLSPEVEEGICQVLAHMWLESELYSAYENNDALSSSSSSPMPPSYSNHELRIC